jgi:hypothetical protein
VEERAGVSFALPGFHFSGFCEEKLVLKKKEFVERQLNITFWCFTSRATSCFIFHVRRWTNRDPSNSFHFVPWPCCLDKKIFFFLFNTIFPLLPVALALLLVLVGYIYHRYTSGKFIVPKRKNKHTQPILSATKSKKPIKMSVVGIDLGNLNTVVAVARNRGIDVITNDTSNRATPSLVCFGERQRYLGMF